MLSYYNEHDPFAAQWLRNLIAAGHIAPGYVDERSIDDVRPDDLAGYVQCHFFAGIGVWSYALRQAGWRDDRPVWTGSCPCQSFSAAGKGAGLDDERHLWPSWFWLIAQCRPYRIFGEQVEAAIRHGWLDLVQADLEGIGYAVGPVGIPAAGIGAPHIRQRLWFVADARGERVRAEERRDDVDAPLGDGGETGQQRLRALARDGGAGVGGLADATARRLGIDGRASWPCGHVAQRDATCRFCGHARIGHDRQYGCAEDGCDCVMGDAERARLEGLAGDGDGGDESGRFGSIAAGSTAASGADGALADTGDRLVPQSFGESQGRDGTRPTGADDPGAIQPTNGYWRDADWIACRDEKWRPVEPGTFPLAHGAANRVGRLRGYGNAIVPQVAEAFIRAADEIIDH